MSTHVGSSGASGASGYPESANITSSAATTAGSPDAFESRSNAIRMNVGVPIAACNAPIAASTSPTTASSPSSSRDVSKDDTGRRWTASLFASRPPPETRSLASRDALSPTNARHAAPAVRAASLPANASNTACSRPPGDRRCARSPRGGGCRNAASAVEAQPASARLTTLVRNRTILPCPCVASARGSVAPSAPPTLATDHACARTRSRSSSS
mmetsp:Transcript_10636/g.47927  ORF Transcript_10636/g.47927 Transcript_10636/m.47927 type:complete len:214 (-) Transcript_10636:1087-1728(-)